MRYGGSFMSSLEFFSPAYFREWNISSFCLNEVMHQNHL